MTYRIRQAIKVSIEAFLFRRRWLGREQGVPAESDLIAALHSNVPGPLSIEELQWLFAQAAAAVRLGDIVEIDPQLGQSSCCLGLACRKTGRVLHCLWGSEVLQPATSQAEQFITWHKNIIQKCLVPYVRPLTGHERWEGTPIAMVLFGPRAGSADAQAAVDLLEKVGHAAPLRVVSFTGGLLQELGRTANKGQFGRLHHADVDGGQD